MFILLARYITPSLCKWITLRSKFTTWPCALSRFSAKYFSFTSWLPFIRHNLEIKNVNWCFKLTNCNKSIPWRWHDCYCSLFHWTLFNFFIQYLLCCMRWRRSRLRLPSHSFCILRTCFKCILTQDTLSAENLIEKQNKGCLMVSVISSLR